MTIWIFGDSFADIRPIHRFLPELVETSWPYKLSQKYKVQNFAESGSGIGFSYAKFLENYHRISADDRVIFIASSFDRILLDRAMFLNQIKTPHINPAKLQSHNKISKNKNLIIGLDSYYKFIHNPTTTFNSHYTTLIYLRLLLGKKLLLLQVFEEHSTENFPLLAGKKNKIIDNPNMLLYGIQEHEQNNIWGNAYDLSNTKDYRCCHLTEIHHTMLYEKINKWCETGKFFLSKKDLLSIPIEVQNKIKKQNK